MGIRATLEGKRRRHFISIERTVRRIFTCSTIWFGTSFDRNNITVFVWKRMEPGLSADELKKQLFQSFLATGVLDSLKSQLRATLLHQLKARDSTLMENANGYKLSLHERVLRSVILDFLEILGFQFTKSIFLPESGLDRWKSFSREDLLDLLSLNGTDSPQDVHHSKSNCSILERLIEKIEHSTKIGRQEASTQTSSDLTERSLGSYIREIDEAYMKKVEKDLHMDRTSTRCVHGNLEKNLHALVEKQMERIHKLEVYVASKEEARQQYRGTTAKEREWDNLTSGVTLENSHFNDDQARFKKEEPIMRNNQELIELLNHRVSMLEKQLTQQNKENAEITPQSCSVSNSYASCQRISNEQEVSISRKGGRELKTNDWLIENNGHQQFQELVASTTGQHETENYCSERDCRISITLPSMEYLAEKNSFERLASGIGKDKLLNKDCQPIFNPNVKANATESKLIRSSNIKDYDNLQYLFHSNTRGPQAIEKYTGGLQNNGINRADKAGRNEPKLSSTELWGEKKSVVEENKCIQTSWYPSCSAIKSAVYRCKIDDTVDMGRESGFTHMLSQTKDVNEHRPNTSHTCSYNETFPAVQEMFQRSGFKMDAGYKFNDRQFYNTISQHKDWKRYPEHLPKGTPFNIPDKALEDESESQSPLAVQQEDTDSVLSSEEGESSINSPAAVAQESSIMHSCTELADNPRSSQDSTTKEVVITHKKMSLGLQMLEMHSDPDSSSPIEEDICCSGSGSEKQC